MEKDRLDEDERGQRAAGAFLRAVEKCSLKWVWSFLNSLYMTDAQF